MQFFWSAIKDDDNKSPIFSDAQNHPFKQYLEQQFLKRFFSLAYLPEN